MNMKLRPNLTQPQTSNMKVYEHPWNKHMIAWDAEKEYDFKLNRPNPPSKEAVERAKFVDKTFKWTHDVNL